MYKYLRKYIPFLIIFLSFIFIYLTSTCSANILDSWQDAKSYKPKPVLLLHGFAKGNPNDWNPAKTTLGKYFSKYQPLGSYLETIAFQDPNGSIDTYEPGKTNPQGNSKGWSDKVQDKINELLTTNKYGFYTNKLNLVCHSMSGLAARWYLVNYSSSYVDKLILIGVPNKGSPLAKEVNALSKIPKLGWLTLVPVNSAMSFVRDNVESYTNALLIDISGEAIDDMDASVGGSGFLDKLNSVGHPTSVSYYGIIGIDGNLANWFLFKDWYGGDSVVPKDSQLGTGKVSYKNWIQIHANHWREPEIAAEETDNKILKFLDSTTPGFEITSPASGIEIYESSIHIQGKVYKEYLPADSQLIINVIRQEDGYSLPTQTSFLKASDLWIPNNLDSPVAEFDEVVNFPGGGTYKISCQVKNPAGLISDIKDIWVKVIVPIEIVTWSPTGVSLNLKPFIYAKILSKEYDIAITQTFMSLDGVPVIFSYNFNGNLELEIYHVPLLDLSSTTHTVSVVSQDVEGNTASKTWTFTIYADLNIPPSGVTPPYSSPIGYHWVWRGIGSYQDLGADSLVGYHTRTFSPQEMEGWTDTDFIAEAYIARGKARANAQIVHAGPNNYQRVNEFTSVIAGAYGYREESSICDWTAKHFAVQNLETPNPPYMIDVIPVYTVSGLTYYTDWINDQVIVPVINTNHMGTFVAKNNENYWGGNGRSFVIPYTPTFDMITTANVNFPMIVERTWYGKRAGTKNQYYTWTDRYIGGSVWGWVLTKD